MNTQLPSTTYREIEITYNENEDRWQFTLDGRERFAGTLKAAKEAIDAPPKKNKKPFTPIEAYRGMHEGFIRCRVTSIAEGSCKGYVHYWITYESLSRKGSFERCKIYGNTLYAINPKNDALIAEIQELRNQIVTLQKKAEAVQKKLEHLPEPSFEE